MAKLTQHDYWNGRADHWNEMAEPLIPAQVELDFQRKYLLTGGDALVLGVTPEFCELARQVSGSVTAVDFSEKLIDKLSIDGVDYVHSDWLGYLREADTQYDNILTDGGLACLSYPEDWRSLASLLWDRLQPGGIFSPRVYLSTDQPPLDSYDNPNLERFVTSIMLANESNNWSVHPRHQDYDAYDFVYTFPPDELVRSVFQRFELVDRLVPEYEEGDRFVTYVFRKPQEEFAKI